MGDRTEVSALPEFDYERLGIEMKGTFFGLVMLSEKSLGLPWKETCVREMCASLLQGFLAPIIYGLSPFLPFFQTPLFI